MRTVPLFFIVIAGIAALAAVITLVYRRFPLHLIYMYERRKGDERSFGYDHFASLLQSLGDVPFAEVIPKIEERFAGYTCDDDYTMLVIEADGAVPGETAPKNGSA